MRKKSPLLFYCGIGISAAAAALLIGPGFAAREAAPPPPTIEAVEAAPVSLAREQVAPSAELRLPSGAVKSVLKVEKRMRYGEFIWNEDHVPAGPTEILVDIEGQTISVFRAGQEIGTAVILYGAEGKATPAGQFPILEKRKKHRSSIYDADMPYTLRLTYDGIAIHASDVRWGAATHGCIGVPLEFAKLLFERTKVGDSVSIVKIPSAMEAGA